MGARRLLLLAAVLTALLGAGLWLKNKERAALPVLGEETVRLIPGALAFDALTAVEFSLGDPPEGRVRIEKDPAGAWRLPGAYNAPADVKHLREFVEFASRLSGEERARGEKWFGDFGLAEEQALKVLFQEGETVRAGLLVGRSPKTPGLEFVRELNGEAVYSLKEGLLNWVGLWGDLSADRLLPAGWADHRLFPVKPEAVHLVRTEEHLKGEEWAPRAEREVHSSEKVKEWLGRLATLHGDDLVDPATQTEFKPAWRWIFQMEDGSSLRVEETAPFGDTDSKKATVRLSPEGPYFTTLASLTKQYRDELASLNSSGEPPSS